MNVAPGLARGPEVAHPCSRVIDPFPAIHGHRFIISLIDCFSNFIILVTAKTHDTSFMAMILTRPIAASAG